MCQGYFYFDRKVEKMLKVICWITLYPQLVGRYADGPVYLPGGNEPFRNDHYPLLPHGGSRFSRTVETIAQLQPEAKVSQNGLTISRNDVADCHDQVIEWISSLEL